MTVQGSGQRASIEAQFEKAGLGNAAEMRGYVKTRENVGNHVLATRFDDAAADRVMQSCVRLMALPAERERFAADSKYHPVYQALRFELLARIGVATAVTGAEVAMAVSMQPNLTIFINSMCGCASGNVRSALEAVAKDKSLAPAAMPMLAVMDTGGCGGDAGGVSASANTLETRRAVDYVREDLLGDAGTAATQASPAFLVMRDREASAFVTRGALDKKPVELIVQRIVQATS